VAVGKRAASTPPVTGCVLDYINLYDCVQITNHSLQLIAYQCPRLKWLGVYGLDEISVSGLVSVLRGCHTLTGLDVGGCHRITSRDVEQLQKAFVRVRF